MNRIPVRGVGFAAAAVAAASLAWGAPAAGSQTVTTDGRVSTTLSSAVFVTAYDARVDGSAAAMQQLHAARLRTVHAAADAQRLHLLHLARLAHLRAQTAAAQSSRSAVRLAPVVPVVPGTVRALGRSMAAARGWTGQQFACLDAVWTHESHWRVNASNSSSGAYGIPQARPGSKMGSAGSDWRTNPATQIAWGLAYIARAYGDPCSAWSFWQSHRWY